jgi:hypothetical protein
MTDQILVLRLGETAGVLIAVWVASVLLSALFTRPHAPRAGPATMELGSEPPAVVNLLVNHCELTADAADATLIDLAARRILGLEQLGSDPAAMLVRVRIDRPLGLLPFEQLVFDRVRQVAGDRRVPIGEMAGHYAAGGPRWMGQLHTAVLADARSRGLTRERGTTALCALVTPVVAIGLTCLAAMPFVLHRAGPAPVFWVVMFFAWWTVFMIIYGTLVVTGRRVLSGERYTGAGRAAGKRWLGVARWLSGFESLADLPPAAVAVWDRYLAYGVALGTNPVASRALDLRTGRVQRYISHYTGRPRAVMVRYRRGMFAYTPARARVTWAAIVLVLWTWFWWSYGTRLGGLPTPLRSAVLAVGIVHPARAAYRLLRGTVNLLAPVTVTGRVLGIHPLIPGQVDWHNQLVVLDDGRHDRARPWMFVGSEVEGIRVGDVVQVNGERWTRWGRRVTPVAVRAGAPPGDGLSASGRRSIR